MYAGKPSIVSNWTPIKRIVEETNCGIIYEFDNPEDFATKVLLLESSPELYYEFKENGIKAVKSAYAWEIDKLVLNKVYEK